MRAVTRAIGLLLVVVGAIALLGTLGADLGLARAAFRWLMPLTLVGVGLWVLAVAWESGTHRAPVATVAAGAWTAAQPRPTSHGIDRVLGEIEVVGSYALAPSRFQTALGEIRLDLSQAVVAEGETQVSVRTLIGEVRVLLPPDVGAIVRGRTLLGEVELLGAVSGPLLPGRTVATDDYATSRRRIRLDVQTGIGRVGVRRARAAATQSVASVAARAAAGPAAAHSLDTAPSFAGTASAERPAGVDGRSAGAR